MIKRPLAFDRFALPCKKQKGIVSLLSLDNKDEFQQFRVDEILNTLNLGKPTDSERKPGTSTDNLESLFTIYDHTLGTRQYNHDLLDGRPKSTSTDTTYSLSSENVCRVIIHTCDHILKTHNHIYGPFNKKNKSKSNEKPKSKSNETGNANEKVEKSSDQEMLDEPDSSENSIDTLPDILPSKFHIIYAAALLKMGQILHLQEQETTIYEDKQKASSDLHDDAFHQYTPLDFTNASIERCELGLEQHPTNRELLFMHSCCLITKIRQMVDDIEIDDEQVLKIEVIRPITKAQVEFEKAEAFIGKHKNTETKNNKNGSSWKKEIYGGCVNEMFQVLQGLLEISEWIESVWTVGETSFGDKLITLKKEYLKWAIQRYKNMLSRTESFKKSREAGSLKNSKEGKERMESEIEQQEVKDAYFVEQLASKAYTGLGQCYLARAIPYIQQFEECVMQLPDDNEDDTLLEDERLDGEQIKALKIQLESATKIAIELVQKGLDYFIEAEPKEEEPQNGRQEQKGKQQEEEDEEEKEKNEYQDKQKEMADMKKGQLFAHTGEALIQLGNLTQDHIKQNELYKKAATKLNIAQQLGFGDYSNQIRDLVG